MSQKNNLTLENYLEKVKNGEKRFENAFQSISRMMVGNKDFIEKVTMNGKRIYDFQVFRQGKRPIVAMYDGINSFVSFVKDAAEGGSSKEMAFVLVGEPGNGKTFFVESLCTLYREFLSIPENQKFTFRLNLPDDIPNFGNINVIESQTYEDPMILAMNLIQSKEDNKAYLEELGFSDKQIEGFYENYRPLGACSDFILNVLRNHVDGNIEELKKLIELVPVPLSETLGTVTGKYPAKDKITSSAVDLLGEESIQRLLHITDSNNPYKFDIRRGALARVAGGGIHFSDEIFRNKKDLVQVYLGVIQNRSIEIDGFKWPIDTLIVGTSNNSVFNEFLTEDKEAPIVDRCRICYIGHNTNYKLQKKLTDYAIGGELKSTTITGEDLHIDPNLNLALSVAFTLSRLPKSNKLSPVEMMKLAAGEVAGDKSIKTLVEVIDGLTYEPDVTKRFGQKGLGHRDLGRTIQLLKETAETNESGCIYAGDIFEAMTKVILDYVPDSDDKKKYLGDLNTAKGRYREMIMTEIFNAYMNEPLAIKKDVMNYINMIVGLSAKDLGPDKMWYGQKDEETGEIKGIKIDEKYINSVEQRLELKNEEEKETFRTGLIKIYGQKITRDPNYDFMDNQKLVRAVTEVKLMSDVGSAGSLVGALANRNNDENQQVYDRMIDTMLNKLGYCKSCAEKTIEYFCTQEDLD